MGTLEDGITIDALVRAAVSKHPSRPFFIVPANAERSYLPNGAQITYRELGQHIEQLCAIYQNAGFGLGHRVAMLLENRPDYVLHKLALNSIGVCCIPINPDYRSAEITYLIDHSQPDLLLTIDERHAQLHDAISTGNHKPTIRRVSTVTAGALPDAPRPRCDQPLQPATPATILYTSGTTGRPKGCILSHGYEIASGAWYANLGGTAALREGQDRIYNPLPLHHVNSAVVSLMAAIWTGNCQIQSDRFHPVRWWREIVETQATVAHYLGVIVPLLMAQPPSPDERNHSIRFGLGAGVEPQLHRQFEDRFNFPLVEIWGMTEMVRLLADNVEPRHVGTRTFGKAVPGIDVRVVDDNGNDCVDEKPGEMLIRHSQQTPRRGFFSGYLHDDAATESAWAGGWFHTGDIVWRARDGLLHFVDRKKNIIRRSGENIAAAEVEALLLTHPYVKQAAVIAVKDEIREEEVLACIVLKEPRPAAEVAPDIFRFCMDRLAYYKAPGWLHVVDDLPTTASQKIQKHNIFPAGVDPRQLDGIVDLRAMKKRRRNG